MLEKDILSPRDFITESSHFLSIFTDLKELLDADSLLKTCYLPCNIIVHRINNNNTGQAEYKFIFDGIVLMDLDGITSDFINIKYYFAEDVSLHITLDSTDFKPLKGSFRLDYKDRKTEERFFNQSDFVPNHRITWINKSVETWETFLASYEKFKKGEFFANNPSLDNSLINEYNYRTIFESATNYQNKSNHI